MTRKTQTIAALAATALLVPALLLAAGRGPRAQGHGLAQRVIERLDLTPEQVQDIREILASHKQELTVELTRIKEARGKMFDTIHAETYSEPAIRNAATAAGRAEAELAVTRGQIVQEIRQVLTPEQREEAKEMFADGRAFVENLIARLRERLTSDPLAGL
jgi:Spy/CpxP family protein refolding chaperone